MQELLSHGSIIAAPRLLGAVLTYIDDSGRPLSGRIVETEAYPPGDPSTYKFTGKKLSQSAHFAAAGTIFMHFSHGKYNCLNIACGQAGTGDSLLIRAIEPLEGRAVMWHHRYGEPMSDDATKAKLYNLTSGPGKLIQALGLQPSLNGLSILAPDAKLTIRLGQSPAQSVTTTRIGLTKGADLALRWYDPDSRYISKR